MITIKQLTDFLAQWPPDISMTVDIREWDDELYFDSELQVVLSR